MSLLFCRAMLMAGVLARMAEAVAPPQDYSAMWGDFKSKFGKAYNDDKEEQQRFEIFKANVDTIGEVNGRGLSYTLGVNQFADLTADEFVAKYTGFKKPERPWGDLPYLGRHEYSGEALPKSVDWTMKKAVTPVKNQGQCGSCWAFSTTGSLEGAWEIATGKLVSLSEQQFVDCDHNGDMGCQGGAMDNAFGYAEKNALCTEDSYSYTGSGGTCKASSCTVGIPKGDVTGFKDVASDSEQALMSAVAQQPVSIAIEADKQAFQLYHGGVLSATCGDNLDHGVLAVGYGTDSGKDYWKVKNSWGPSYGENGYVRLLRGKGKKGECGLLSGPPSYPVVKNKPGPAPGPTPPGPSPTPPTPPPPAPSTHYGAPPCLNDEKQGDVQRTDSSLVANKTVCAPSCDTKACPTDKPQGAQGSPLCALMDTSSYSKYCALSCSASVSCPDSGTCVYGGAGIMICTYNKTDDQPYPTLQITPPSEGTINI